MIRNDIIYHGLIAHAHNERLHLIAFGGAPRSALTTCCQLV